MGQAKRRGNFQTRRKAAIARELKQRTEKSVITQQATLATPVKPTRRNRLALTALVMATLGIPTSKLQ